jgi:class 3 adenylate cyclase
MLDPWLYNCIAEMLTKSMSSDQIDEMGCLLMDHHCSHTILGIDNHITVSARKAAGAFLAECVGNKCEEKLLKFLVEIDGSPLLGKPVQLKGIEELMNAMARSGYVYDWKKRKVRSLKEDPQELPGWGALREGKRYDITIASIDIAGSSALVKKHGLKKAEKLYYQFWSFLRRVLSVYDGRIWNWAGDGGIVAFAFKEHQQRSVLCAMELQSLMAIFNADPRKPVQDTIALRIGIDTGKVRFSADTGQIVSEAINYAAHLEKGFTEPGGISISGELAAILPKTLRALCHEKGIYEGRKALSIGVQGSP